MSRIHALSAGSALMLIIVFLSSTVTVELIGGHWAIAVVKKIIVMGLFLLVPSLALAGATGFRLAKSFGGRLAERKRARMPIIAANGILLLAPAAILLNHFAAQGYFGGWFYLVQAVELAAGATNLLLMGLSARDGLRLAGRLANPRSCEHPRINSSGGRQDA